MGAATAWAAGFAGGCAVLREVSPKALGQGAGIQADVDAQVTTQRRDTVNDASLFWALVVNNTLVALGLPIIGGLLWYKRRQMQSWGAGGKP
ncbi:MAG: hypothetical protein BroJett003_07220 [Planctomycetota bacterium]|nr:MAG: hypothetical protein BroJett003_07220 [Planctomycetota bacterium]